ncbi:heme NO-binding domain-containing protein [Roseivivax sp. CAU 1761]
MLGLVNRMLQVFVVDTYGPSLWSDMAAASGLGDPEFEAMLHYDSAVTDRLLTAAARQLDKPRAALLEDVGTYLVCHSNMQPVRRLLRFCGVDFLDFLHSLEDLRDRVRLAVPDLVLPDLEVTEAAGRRLRIACRGDLPGFGHVLVGLLRAMADDHGALVLLDHLGDGPDGEILEVTLIDECFAEGRRFLLGRGALEVAP